METFLNVQYKRKQKENNSKEENKWKFRKYDNSYFRLSFTCIKIDYEKHFKCVIYLKIFIHAYMP